MKFVLFMGLALFSSPSVFASVECTASASHYQRVGDSLVAQLVHLPTTSSQSPSGINTILAERLLGTQLAIEIPADESKVTDKTNYINTLSNGKNIFIGSKTVLHWEDDNTVTIVHQSSEGWEQGHVIDESEDVLAATFTMICRRTIKEN